MSDDLDGDNSISEGMRPFEEIRLETDSGTEYWSARDLMPVLGYSTWQRFEEAISRAQTACFEAAQLVKDHFSGSVKLVRIGSETSRRVPDYHLSRYACYLIAQNGDSRIQAIALAQTYFAVQTRRQELADAGDELERRAHLRNRVMDHNKDLASAAKEAGVRSPMFGVFQDAGYKGLYGNLGVQALKTLRGLGPNENVLDRMGRTELAANDFRITQAEEKLRRDRVQGEKRAIDTHREVGERVRDAIRDLGGTMPEQLPVEPTIKPVIDKEKRKERRLNGTTGKRKSPKK